MAKQRYTTEEVIHKLRETDVLIGQGQTVAQATKQIGVTGKAYFRWRTSHGGLRVDQAKRLRDLEADNARLKKAVAELTVDKIILKEVAEATNESSASAGRSCSGALEAPVLGATDLPCVGHWALDAALCAATAA